MRKEYYKNIEEAKKAVQYATCTNPQYPHFKQTHFTAGSEEQFLDRIKEIKTEDSKGDNNLISIHNKFYQVLIKNNNWIKYTQNESAIVDTFRYIFYKLKKGIFVRIHNNKVETFLPFSNAEFKNEWSHLIKLDSRFNNGNIVFDLISFFQHMYSQIGNNFNTDFEVDPSKWYTNNGIIKVEKDAEGDSSVSEMADMFKSLCERKKIKDCHFFINRRDNPILTKDGYEPYDNIFGEKVNLLSHSYKKYTPILSVCGRDNYGDIIIPTGEDWARVNFRKKYFDDMIDRDFSLTITPWDQRSELAVFRGTSTGENTTIETNPRIRLAFMSHTQGRKKYLDCGITRWNVRCRKHKDSEFLKIIECKKFNIPTVNFLTPSQQTSYKYLIHLDGHASAFRLSFEMSYGCCILKTESKYKLWFSDMLKPYEHYVPIKEDLSDLYKQIDWCRKNDKKCKMMGENCQKFYKMYLEEDGIYDYLEKLLNEL